MEEIESLVSCITSVLSDLESKVLSLYLDGRSYEDVGERLGLRHEDGGQRASAREAQGGSPPGLEGRSPVANAA